jgi:uncharacterized BrkB/YihY/UPF0761 family membrane protein
MREERRFAVWSRKLLPLLLLLLLLLLCVFMCVLMVVFR